ncbi:MAG: SIS domain-containing protein [Natronohydrobacter sp.]|nr:SIS domain-containing protein [Natronohydrobacter sp.]
MSLRDALLQINIAEQRHARLVRPAHHHPRRCRGKGESCSQTVVEAGLFQQPAREISYIHAEAYAAGELKHGPIALIDKDLPVVVMAPRDTLFDKTISNMQEVMARSGQIILLSDKTGLQDGGEVRHVITLPSVPPFIAPFVYAVPAQMLGYHTALARGTDVDQPRSLAKSVTVE